MRNVDKYVEIIVNTYEQGAFREGREKEEEEKWGERQEDKGEERREEEVGIE